MKKALRIDSTYGYAMAMHCIPSSRMVVTPSGGFSRVVRFTSRPLSRSYRDQRPLPVLLSARDHSGVPYRREVRDLREIRLHRLHSQHCKNKKISKFCAGEGGIQ